MNLLSKVVLVESCNMSGLWDAINRRIKENEQEGWYLRETPTFGNIGTSSCYAWLTFEKKEEKIGYTDD